MSDPTETPETIINPVLDVQAVAQCQHCNQILKLRNETPETCQCGITWQLVQPSVIGVK